MFWFHFRFDFSRVLAVNAHARYRGRASCLFRYSAKIARSRKKSIAFIGGHLRIYVSFIVWLAGKSPRNSDRAEFDAGLSVVCESAVIGKFLFGEICWFVRIVMASCGDYSGGGISPGSDISFIELKKAGPHCVSLCSFVGLRRICSFLHVAEGDSRNFIFCVLVAPFNFR